MFSCTNSWCIYNMELGSWCLDGMLIVAGGSGDRGDSTGDGVCGDSVNLVVNDPLLRLLFVWWDELAVVNIVFETDFSSTDTVE